MVATVRDLAFGYKKNNSLFENFDLDFVGKRIALLGPNGAGKSTLLSLVAGALKPPKSEMVLVNGVDAASNAKKYLSQISFMPQNIPVIKGFSVRDHVSYFAWLKGIPKRKAIENTDKLLSEPLLEGLGNKKVSELSGGQLRRVGIGSALAHGARLILMDEPTAGLDAIQRNNFREVITQLPPDVQLVISTHQTEDIADLYDQIIVLNHGRTIFDGSHKDFLSHGPDSSNTAEQAEHAFINLVNGTH